MRSVKDIEGKDDCQRVSVETAAREIGVHPQYLRLQMKNKKWDLGLVSYPKDKNGQCSYIIFRSKLDKLMGKETA